MLWLAKIKKRLPFNRRRRRVNKALRRRKLEKYMPVILFLLGLLAIMIAIVALLVVKIGMPFYETITEPHAARDWVLSFGSWSYLVLFAITYLQVVIAILPGEPFQIASGLAFGPIVGSLITTIGTLLASITTFMLTRIFGYKIIEFFFSERTRSKMDLREYSEESIERVVFIAFLIPGTPKDFLAYAVGLTPLSLLTWIRITVIARFPPIIMATLGGNLLSSGNFQSAAVTILIGNVISLFVYLLYELHHRWKRRSA
jgi:uncharacterized membrane protein YdjX (TVP38/TMEM64 family)